MPYCVPGHCGKTVHSLFLSLAHGRYVIMGEANNSKFSELTQLKPLPNLPHKTIKGPNYLPYLNFPMYNLLLKSFFSGHPLHLLTRGSLKMMALPI